MAPLHRKLAPNSINTICYGFQTTETFTVTNRQQLHLFYKKVPVLCKIWKLFGHEMGFVKWNSPEAASPAELLVSSSESQTTKAAFTGTTNTEAINKGGTQDKGWITNIMTNGFKSHRFEKKLMFENLVFRMRSTLPSLLKINNVFIIQKFQGLQLFDSQLNNCWCCNYRLSFFSVN